MEENIDFVLIVPTHNRHDSISYSMEYYNNCGFDVIYVDSSECEYLYAKNQYANITYVYFKGMDFSGKLLRILEKVSSKYVGLCADDDFLILDRIFLGISFLQGQEIIKAYIGANYGINRENSNQIIPLNESIDCEYLRGDTEKYFLDYTMILWGLYNKEAFYKAIKIIEKSDFENDNFIELTLGTILLIEGGIKRVSTPLLVREIGQSDNWGLRHKHLTQDDLTIKMDFQKIRNTINSVYGDDYFTEAFTAYISGIEDKVKNNNLYTKLKRHIKKRYRLWVENKKEIYIPIKEIFSKKN